MTGFVPLIKNYHSKHWIHSPLKKTTVHIYPFPTSIPILSTPHLLQTRNDCDVTNLSPSSVHYQANVSHITKGRGEIAIFTPPISLSGANTLQNKSQCLSPNLVWQRVATRAILGSLWCQSPISPVTFFFKERVDFLETLPFATSTVYSCT